MPAAGQTFRDRARRPPRGLRRSASALAGTRAERGARGDVNPAAGRSFRGTPSARRRGHPCTTSRSGESSAGFRKIRSRRPPASRRIAIADRPSALAAATATSATPDGGPRGRPPPGFCALAGRDGGIPEFGRSSAPRAKGSPAEQARDAGPPRGIARQLPRHRAGIVSGFHSGLSGRPRFADSPEALLRPGQSAETGAERSRATAQRQRRGPPG